MYPLSKFQVYSTVLSTIVTLLGIGSPELDTHGPHLLIPPTLNHSKEKTMTRASAGKLTQGMKRENQVRET